MVWKKIKQVFLTVGSAMLSFWFLWIWTIIFAVTGVLLMVDWIHRIWTDRRIPWIKKVTDGWSKLFDHPFSKQ